MRLYLSYFLESSFSALQAKRQYRSKIPEMVVFCSEGVDGVNTLDGIMEKELSYPEFSLLEIVGPSQTETSLMGFI